MLPENPQTIIKKLKFQARTKVSLNKIKVSYPNLEFLKIDWNNERNPLDVKTLCLPQTLVKLTLCSPRILGLDEFLTSNPQIKSLTIRKVTHPLYDLLKNHDNLEYINTPDDDPRIQAICNSEIYNYSTKSARMAVVVAKEW